MQAKEQQPVVLLIDDSPSIHRLLAFKLKNEELTLLTAFDGAEGLDMAATHQPSLILLDLNMPVMDGFQTLKALKNDARTIKIPIIVLSGNSHPEDKVQSFDLGAMDFVCKPFDIHELRARINSAIRLHRLMEMLEMRARIDGLTGLWNRAYLNDRLAAELDASARTGSSLSLVLCDLDHFKKLNDTFGHPAGDTVLRGFASLLTAELRSYDVACRYGGEEFAIILPDSSKGEAVTVCDRIRQKFEAQRWAAYPAIRAAASFGVTDRGLDAPTAAAWLEAADRALYQAKQSGRNQVCAFQGREDTGTPKLALAS